MRVGRGPDGLELLDSAWDQLVLSQQVPNPALLGDWLRAVASADDDPPLVIRVEEGSQLVAGAALRVWRFGGRHGPRVLTWLGPRALQNTPEILVDPQTAGRAGAVLVQEMITQAPLLHLPMTALTGAAAEAAGTAMPWCRLDRAGETFFVALPVPRLQQVRRSADRAVRRAGRAGVPVSIAVHSGVNDVRPALERMFRLYRRVWHGRGGEMRRFAASARQRAAYRQAVHALAGTGRVRIVEITEQGRPVAVQLGLLAGRGAMAHTTALARDARLHGAGHVALLAWAEEATIAGAEEMDLSRGGGEPGGPKHRLGPTSTPWGTVVAARNRPLQHGFDAALRVRYRLRRARLRM